MTRKPPATWTQAEVSVLTRLHIMHGDTPEGLHKTEKAFDRHTPTDVRAKMIELELIPKPVKPELSEEQATSIEHDLKGAFLDWAEPQRTLAIRYAISLLQDLLPKRAAKAPAESEPAA